MEALRLFTRKPAAQWSRKAECQAGSRARENHYVEMADLAAWLTDDNSKSEYTIEKSKKK
jgi:hypothetical protein